jgi:hypothetical protein
MSVATSSSGYSSGLSESRMSTDSSYWDTASQSVVLVNDTVDYYRGTD